MKRITKQFIARTQTGVMMRIAAQAMEDLQKVLKVRAEELGYAESAADIGFLLACVEFGAQAKGTVDTVDSSRFVFEHDGEKLEFEDLCEDIRQENYTRAVIGHLDNNLDNASSSGNVVKGPETLQ